MLKDKVVIVGAGPAGLTAAYELQLAGVVDITIIEADSQVGGISKTINHAGNRIDIGGHRFFSKSDWVMNWWQKQLPLQAQDIGGAGELRYKGQQRPVPTSVAVAVDTDRVMLLRNRLSRIYFNQQFFSYPLKLNLDSVKKLGMGKTLLFGCSYVWSKLYPKKPEVSLEDFLINRFGGRLYRQFFKEYTEKVWGVACTEISSSWGAQRIKSLSIVRALVHAFKSSLGIGSEKTETSLIESFIYPKYGPGQMWEVVAEKFVAAGGTLLMNAKVQGLEVNSGQVQSVQVVCASDTVSMLACSALISTMPIKDLVRAAGDGFSASSQSIAENLQYRDFITVGLLYRKEDFPRPLDDNWIYIQEPGVKVGRVQVFNNWSPYMVSDGETIWLGLEYFCKDTDDLWALTDTELKLLGQQEMEKIGLVSSAEAKDAVVVRVPKAYPGYFGEAYEKFDDLRAELDTIENLFLVGRNGMHRYNNQDHSMLTAKEAVSQIVENCVNKDRIWNVNIDDSYHEEKS